MSSDEIEQQMLSEARSEIIAADQKASITLAALGIGFSAVLGGLLAGNWRPSHLHGAGEPAWWFGAAIAFVSVGCAAAAVWPRYAANPAAGEVNYWADIAAQSKFTEVVEALNRILPGSQDRTRNQLWSISKIVRSKYRLIRMAMSSACVAVIVLLAASLIGR